MDKISSTVQKIIESMGEPSKSLFSLFSIKNIMVFLALPNTDEPLYSESNLRGKPQKDRICTSKIGDLAEYKS
jgi:hypothetical protein